MKNSFVVLFLIICCFYFKVNSIVCDPPVGTPVNEPLGEGFGINKGRVVWVINRDATTWDGINGYYYDSEYLDQSKVDIMMDNAIRSLTGNEDVVLAWNMLFRDFNKRKHGQDVGYKSGQTIAMKINLNADYGGYGDNNGNEVSPQFLRSLMTHLTKYVGADQKDLYIYDASRLIMPHFQKMFGQYFPNINLFDNRGGEGSIQRVQPDPTSYLQFSNTEVPAQKQTKLPTFVNQADYVIEIDNFRGHSIAGVTLSGKNWFGTIYRPDIVCDFAGRHAGHWCPASLHKFVNITERPMGTYTPLVDLLGHPKLTNNALFVIADGLYGGPLEESCINDEDCVPSPPVIFEMEPFNDHWSSSIFISQDPIALDSVALDILRSEPHIPYSRIGCSDNYLHEGALANNPPSGTVYNPSGQKQLESLGIHEHWNNPYERKYTRNFDPVNGKGIELVEIDLSTD
ncbi:hypothetical protein M0813_18033 [Anaeramoeba flamelloides]|uniref:DUF362 domain-containing protein n=1 Tax=Anaeramoeba flamelloides TaxID=1746091 RepID=A0ABQ8YTH0_9EUKA|nr:hypothetical protein M0813_18033 [Anaeramoeba flamelloides]